LRALLCCLTRRSPCPKPFSPHSLILGLVSEVLVDAVPRLSIGEMSARPQDQESGGILFGTISGIVPFPDGRFVVGDGLARELLVFSGEGRLLNRFGGNGDGPGELRGIRELYSCGDTAGR